MNDLNIHDIPWEKLAALFAASPRPDAVFRLLGREAVRSRFTPIEIADACSCAGKANERHRRRLIRMFEQYQGMSFEQIIEALKATGPRQVGQDGDPVTLFLFDPIDPDS